MKPWKTTINLSSTTLSRLNPTYADGIYNKGDILICLGKINEAIECMSKALELRPGWPLYLCNRGK
jgi:tetratricopeptide (TPR) repeat protein